MDTDIAGEVRRYFRCPPMDAPLHPAGVLDLQGEPLPPDSPAWALTRGEGCELAAPLIVDFGRYLAASYHQDGGQSGACGPSAAVRRFRLHDGQWYVFRCVEVWGAVRKVWAQLESRCTLPVTPETLAGYFVCSDDLLNRIWFAALYTVQLNCMYNNPSPGPYGDQLEGLSSYAFYDGPRRDRRIFTWFDSTGNLMAYQALNAVEVARTTYDFLVGQSPPGDFLCRDEPLQLCLDRSAFTEYDLWEFLLHSGDLGYIEHYGPRLWRHVEEKVQSTRDHRGLYHGTLMLPVAPGYEASLPNQTTVYRGLKAASMLAAELGKPELSARFDGWAAELGSVINSVFWDEQAGAYRYTPQSDHFDEMGNAMAVLHGVAPAGRVPRVLALLKDRHWRLWRDSRWGPERPWGPTDFDRPWVRGEAGFEQPLTGWGWDEDYNYSPGGSNYNYCIAPQMAAYEAAAHFLRGREGDGLTVIRRCFGNMVEQGSDTLWEQASHLGQHRYLCGRNGGSLCHRWAAMAGSVLTEYVLGVRATAPGYRRFLVAPHCCDLEWATGQVPAPAGPVRVSWWRAGGRFEVEIEVPAGALCELRLPFVEQAVVNGRPAAAAAVGVELREGRHRVQGREGTLPG